MVTLNDNPARVNPETARRGGLFKLHKISYEKVRLLSMSHTGKYAAIHKATEHNTLTEKKENKTCTFYLGCLRRTK